MQQRLVQVVPGPQLAQLPSSYKPNEVQAANQSQNITHSASDDNFFFFLNEKKITLDKVDPTMTLNDFIRGQRTQ